MSTKIRPRRPPPPPRPGFTKPAQPVRSTRFNRPTIQQVANSLLKTTERFKKRRTGLWAAGVAIIVGVGAVTGAQLKTSQQAKKRFAKTEAKETTTFTAAIEDGHTTSDVYTQHDNTRLKLSPSSDDAGQATSKGGVIVGDTNYDERQIAYLEDRRGVLMKERFDLEKKLERIREKIKREQAMEQRQAVVQDQR